MGTRHITAVVLGGEFRVAQYGQWDGYVDSQGKTVLEFLAQMNRAKFEANLLRTYEPTEEQLTAWYAEVGHVEREDGMIEWDKAKAFSALRPSLSRDTGAGILQIIQDSDEAVPLALSQGFAGDSLFCEWGYVIDLDKNVFEVYRGFNKTPTPADSRFPSGASWLEKTREYEPIVLAKSYPLDALPTLEAFIADFAEPEEAAA